MEQAVARENAITAFQRVRRNKGSPGIDGMTVRQLEAYLREHWPTRVTVTEDYAPRIARGEIWLLEIDSALAGLIVLERHADHAMIFSVAVSPAFQGRKLGIALLDFAEEQARSWGLPEVRLYTNSRMERNIALYAAYGYRETGRRPNPYRPGWTVVDMAKPVDQAA